MKKWIIPCSSLLLMAALIFVSSPYYGSKKVLKPPAHPVKAGQARRELPDKVHMTTGSALTPLRESVSALPAYEAGHPADLPVTLDKEAKIIPAIFGKMDDKGKKSQEDSHLILLLKNVREALDGWLKSINERIESEDVTKIEVRFLEILRSILEWVKEKIDAKIESSERQSRQTEWVWLFRV